MVQSVNKVSEPTCREWSAWVEPLYTILNLPPRDCQQGVQPDCTSFEPTSRGWSAGVHPVLQFPNLLPWDCRPGL